MAGGEETRQLVGVELECRYVILASHRARSVSRRVNVGNNNIVTRLVQTLDGDGESYVDHSSHTNTPECHCGVGC